MRAYPQLSAFGRVGTCRTFRKSRNILGSSSFSKMTVCNKWKKKKGTSRKEFFYMLNIQLFCSSYQNIPISNTICFYLYFYIGGKHKSQLFRILLMHISGNANSVSSWSAYSVLPHPCRGSWGWSSDQRPAGQTWHILPQHQHDGWEHCSVLWFSAGKMTYNFK